MAQSNKNSTTKSGKGRPTPSSKQAKAAAQAEAARKARNQWYAIVAVLALIVIGAVVLYSIFGNAEPITRTPLRPGQ